MVLQGDGRSAAGHGILVEFFGIPGTGKTTLARAVVEELRTRGVRVAEANLPIMVEHSGISAMRRAALAGGFALREPTLAMRSLSEVMASRQRRLNDLRAVALNWLSKCELMRRAVQGPGIQVSDEGLLHAVWSIAYSARDATVLGGSVVEAIRYLLPAVWLVVMVDAADEESAERLRRRPGRLNRLARDSMRDGRAPVRRARSGIAQTRRILGDVVRAAPSADIRVMSVRNDVEADLAANTRLVCERVREAV